MIEGDLKETLHSNRVHVSRVLQRNAGMRRTDGWMEGWMDLIN